MLYARSFSNAWESCHKTKVSIKQYGAKSSGVREKKARLHIADYRVGASRVGPTVLPHVTGEFMLSLLPRYCQWLDLRVSLPCSTSWTSKPHCVHSAVIGHIGDHAQKARLGRTTPAPHSRLYVGPGVSFSMISPPPPNFLRRPTPMPNIDRCSWTTPV